jgi:hypothetical protein
VILKKSPTGNLRLQCNHRFSLLPFSIKHVKIYFRMTNKCTIFNNNKWLFNLSTCFNSTLTEINGLVRYCWSVNSILFSFN